MQVASPNARPATGSGSRSGQNSGRNSGHIYVAGSRSNDARSPRGNLDSYQSNISGQIGVLAGLFILILVGLALASLATWNVLDPSLSNANGNKVQNITGFWGASFADLLIQFSGLASIVALVPPAIWGWLKLIQKPVGKMRKRITAWPFAIIIAAGAFSCLPVSEKWPLPSGFGGIFGDLGLKLSTLFMGNFPSGIWAGLFFIVLIIPALFLTLYAAGLINRPLPYDPDGFTIDPKTGEIFEKSNFFKGIMGAAAHAGFTIKQLFMRLKSADSNGNAAMEKSISGRRDPWEDNLDEDLDHHGRSAGIASTMASKAAALPAAASIMAGRARNVWERLTSAPDDGLERFVDPDFDTLEPSDNLRQGNTSQVNASMSRPVYQGSNDDGDFIKAPDLAPGYGETVYSDDEGEEVDVFAASQGAMISRGATPSARNSALSSKASQSNRVTRQAPTSNLSSDGFDLPQLDFLSQTKNLIVDQSLSTEALEANARMLEGVLEDFGVKGEIINVRPGPVVTLYELEPAPGIKSSRVIGLADDIARSMSAIACRVAVVPGRNAIGIEMPNQRRETVYLRELLASKDYETSSQKLALVLGKDIGGEPIIADLAKMPHLLVAGTTGSGKSVAINTMILSILYRLTPQQVKMIMIDPKMLELSIYDGIPHLLTPVVTDPKKAVVALKWTVREMEERYKKMSKLGVRNIDGYNQRLEQAKQKGEELTRTVQTGYDRETGEAIFETEALKLDAMPFIVVIIDEMADLMMVAGKDIEGAIQRLAQMARAAGIHVIMATQRPSVDVITGTIKANFPTRISFQVTSKIDSRTILGEQGAEQLLGMGDMLYMAGGGKITRVHGPFVADDEVEKVVNHLKMQGVPEYLEAVTQDDDEADEGGAPMGTDALAESNDIYDQAVAVVLRDRKVSTSYVQRRLGIGYNRAASLIERMEQEGLISAANSSGKREILVPGEDETI